MPSCFWYILRLSINHVLTSNYFSCVSIMNAPNLLNCISLAYTLYMWIWHTFLFLYILHLPITPCSYIKLLFLCILRLSLMMRQSRAWVDLQYSYKECNFILSTWFSRNSKPKWRYWTVRTGYSQSLCWSTPCARACTVPTGPPCARAQLTPCARALQDGRLWLLFGPPLHPPRPSPPATYIFRT